jgi:hypothetical protein
MGNPEVDPSGPEVGFGEVWNMWNILASLWEGGAKGMITSFIIHDPRSSGEARTFSNSVVLARVKSLALLNLFTCQ